MTAGTRLPVDLESVTYSQERLNEYFAEQSGGKRLVIVQRHGKEWLELKNAKDLSVWETILAFFGCGAASFRSVCQFCADRSLAHKNFKLMIQTYNAQHASFKQVSDVVRDVIKKDRKSLFERAFEQRNMEVLQAYRHAPWEDVKSLFINEDNSPSSILLEYTKASKMEDDLLELLLELVDRLPESQRNMVHQKADNEGRTAAIILLTKASTLTPKTLNLLRTQVNSQDSDGMTPLLLLLRRPIDALNDITAVLNLSPNLLMKDYNGQGLFHYVCRQSGSYDASVSLIIDTVKKCPPDAKEKLLRDFFAHKNEHGRSPLLQCIHDKNTTRARIMQRLRHEFDWKEDVDSDEDVDAAVSLTDSKHIWDITLGKKKGDA
ncbi:MAG: hypothetical protein JSR46_12150 [Verrucomicrobia bacterium]|nr:hypothetical protein [Verrucomicrobiota bacterium]